MRAVGATPLELVRRYVDEIVTVSEGEIANAVLLLLEIEKTVAEGAAAAALAAVINQKVSLSKKNVGLIVSGGNIDMNLISRIIEQGLIQDGRLSRIAVVIPDRPGSLARLSQRVAELGANILQIGQSRGFGAMAIGETEVELILETAGAERESTTRCRRKTSKPERNEFRLPDLACRYRWTRPRFSKLETGKPKLEKNSAEQFSNFQHFQQIRRRFGQTESGRVIVNVEPLPYSLATVRSPPRRMASLSDR